MDIRKPVGTLFVLIGLLLLGYGLAQDGGRFAGYNLNAIWGVVMGISGALMLLLARRADP